MFYTRTRLDDFLLSCRNICFVDICCDGLSSVVASSFALHVAEMGHSVCYTECGVPGETEKLLYDSVAMDRRFERRGFVDFYSMASEDKRLFGYSNEEYGVNWRLITPENVKDEIVLSDYQMSRLVFSARADMCVFDYGACRRYDKLLDDMDALVFMLDPLPSKLVRGADRISLIQRKFLDNPSHMWIVYNDNDGVSRRQIKSLIRDRQVCWLKELSRRELYSAEFRCRFPWETGAVRNSIEELFVSE